MTRWIVAIAVALVALASTAEATAQRGSSSVGRVDNGRLGRGARLRNQGPGWSVLPEHRARGRTFAVAQLVRAIRRVARRVRRRHRGSVITLGDMSQREGGRISHHISHQSGRDVDVAFFVTGRGRGSPQVRSFVPFDRNLRSMTDGGRIRFDVPRNWTLVESLLADGGIQVQYIFVADYVRQALLEHARTHRRAPRLVARARRVLRSTGTSAVHRDHFHVRVYCPPDDMPRCVDTGAVWPWVNR